MNFETTLITDAATDQQGKLSVLGAFDTIQAAQEPISHPHCAVVFRMRFQRAEEGKQTFRLLLIDQDGNPVGPRVDGELYFGFRPNQDTSIVNLILNMQNMTLPKFGDYRFDLAINGEHKVSLPLYVVKIQQARRAA